MPREVKDILTLYKEMLQDFRSQMLAFCYSHSNDATDADMLLVAIANDLWRSVGTLRPDSTPRQRNRWLHRVMRHSYDDYRRRKPLTVPLDQAYGIAVESNEEAELVEALLEHLAPEERLFLEEYLQSGGPAKLADQSGLTVGAVYQRYHRLIQRLRNIYHNYYA